MIARNCCSCQPEADWLGSRRLQP